MTFLILFFWSRSRFFHRFLFAMQQFIAAASLPSGFLRKWLSFQVVIKMSLDVFGRQWLTSDILCLLENVWDQVLTCERYLLGKLRWCYTIFELTKLLLTHSPRIWTFDKEIIAFPKMTSSMKILMICISLGRRLYRFLSYKRSLL